MMTPHKNGFLLNHQNSKSKALVTRNFELSFEELKLNVLSTVSVLLSKGILKNDRIGIYGTTSTEYLNIIFALWQIGAIPVPLNIQQSEEETLIQIKTADCKFVLISEEFNQKIVNSTVNVIRFPLTVLAEKTIQTRNEIDLNDTAAIIFTSGSSRSPKGVKLSFNSLYQSAINSNKLLRYSHSDRWLLSLPLYHIGGFSILSRSVLWGIPLILPLSISSDDLAIEIKNLQPTFISLVAAQLKNLVDKRVIPNPELKNCLVGGGFSNYELVKKSVELGYPINVVYGSTETASFVTAMLTEELYVKRNSVGRAVPPTNIYIYDEYGNELNPYEIGEIAIQTNSVMQGYISGSEIEERKQNGLYFTGDIGYLDEEGYLFVLGRKDYIISTGGENVNPREVESALLQYPEICEAVVFPLMDEKWGEVVAAAIVLKSKSRKAHIEQIKKFLSGKISKFKVPKKIFIEKELPKTELGKINREKIIKSYML